MQPKMKKFCFKTTKKIVALKMLRSRTVVYVSDILMEYLVEIEGLFVKEEVFRKWLGYVFFNTFCYFE